MIPDHNILDFIPQRPPFVLLDKLKACSKASTESVFEIKEEHLMVKEGKLSPGGLMENIAQTAAAGTGYWSKTNNEEVKRGYIGAIKNLNIYKLPLVNTIINTKVEFINKVLNVNIVKGMVWNNNNELLAECEMKIFLEE